MPETLIAICDVVEIHIAYTTADEEVERWPTLTSNLRLTFVDRYGGETTIRVATYGTIGAGGEFVPHPPYARDGIKIIDHRATRG